MTRFFYTDALAAAWMEDKYGMDFTDAEGIEICVVFSTGEFEARGPFYIHPDSLPLLDTQVGDVVTRDDGTPVLVTHVKENHPAIDGGTGTALYYDNPHIKRGAPWIDKAFVTIIQRDGKAFHWPESTTNKE